MLLMVKLVLKFRKLEGKNVCLPKALSFYAMFLSSMFLMVTILLIFG